MATANPAAPVVNSNVVRLTLTAITNGQRCQNTFDFMDGTGVPCSAADMAALILAWQTLVAVHLKACLSPDTSLESVTAAEIHFGTVASVANLYAPGAIGTAGVHPHDSELMVNLSRVTNTKGKHGRGRCQMGPIPDTFVTPATDPNIINGTGLTAYGLLATDLNQSYLIGAHTWQPVVSTRPISPNVLVLNAAIIQAYLVRETIGTQRRRRSGRGI
jgi:hypothetical protein